MLSPIVFPGESIYRCIVKMKPRRVVIVRGSLEDSAALAEACNSIVASDAGPDFQSDPQANNKRVFTPRTGEVVDATTGLVTNTVVGHF